MICTSCGEGLEEWECKACKRVVGDKCVECHAELAHSIISNQNIHVVGNPFPSMTRQDIETEI